MSIDINSKIEYNKIKKGMSFMYCFNCGCKINDDSKFCHNCGEKMLLVSEPSEVKTNKKDDFNKEALNMYLSDLLSMECIKQNLKEKLNSFDAEINNLIANNCYYVYRTSERDKVHM